MPSVRLRRDLSQQGLDFSKVVNQMVCDTPKRSAELGY